ncbi:Enoyl-CoA hydratase/carnithine racemase [Amycolatopsis arida]|uniref:Enoyl-CoA hydratase/carnithine racemase n=1 Tax=Amycolatopsis arida TaxID=587909 RepID=A0A1I5Z5A0_9PSEU|nr:enoyl-CoA hydratase-related protein [Amycolatopsis arida]TDX90152.1 enoyl-CoA hydratase/carnithine racemase [Amycolatopsis arida]SFQ51639.1 Enoyl-CoA hydratase/carnithine racemase [Amycolatopsis arida]
MTEGLEFVRDGEVGRLTLCRPAKMNAVSSAMWSAIPDVVAEVERDRDLKVLVVTGAGEHFSAGADIGEFRALRSSANGAAAYDRAVEAAVRALAGLRKPSVAVVRGNCIGGGCQLAVACDLRLAATDARFGITPAKLGIVYDFESTRRLVALVGPAHARYLLLSARLLDARRAREIGLVNDVFPVEDLPGEAEDLVRTLCARSQAAVRGMNRIVEKVLAGARAADDEVAEIRLAAVHGEDYAEGVAAFLERRPPRFTHR